MSGFDKEILNPFLQAASGVILSLLGEEPEKEKVELKDIGSEYEKDVVVIIGMAGGVYGRVVIVLRDSVARNIAAAMLEDEVEEMTDVSYSAIGEMGNMIAGNASIDLSERGYSCEITPPTVLSGKELRISKLKDIQMLTVSYKTTSGKVSIILGLKKADKKEKEAE